MIRALTLGLVLAAGAAQAQPACAPRAQLAQTLAQSWGEAPAALGLTRDGALVELWANPVTGSWTLMLTAPNGTACLLADGTAIQIERAVQDDPA